MGRKIPAKKHRGVKDPLIQQAQRLQCLKSKINNPPADPDEQPVPRSLAALFASADQTTKSRHKKKKLQPSRKDPVNDLQNPISCLKKLPGETGREFSLRINSAVRALHETTGQADYPQDNVEEDVKGERMAAQRQRRERKRRRARGGAAAGDGAERQGRAARRFALKNDKIMKARQEKSNKDVIYERIGFGDIVHAPPTLTARPRAAQARQARPREFLLSRLMLGVVEEKEDARQAAVAAYRAIKAAARPRR